MATIKTTAPAKINLTLHVTGQRDDGYHLLDSLVVFAEVGDVISATRAVDMRLTVTGHFAEGVPIDSSNLVLKAAEALRRERGVTMGAHLHLEKNLPHAAGIGGGSSDAAATLKLLAELWDVEPLAHDDPAVLALGADVPVCLRAPTPCRMAGIGEELSDFTALPRAALVLVNPNVEVPTPEAFRGLTQKSNPPMGELPVGVTLNGFTDWLHEQRNDLHKPAATFAPEIEKALTMMRQQRAVLWAGMSGSGATCVAVVKDMGAARQVARMIQIREQSWWVVPTPLLS
ncbi:4-(cytidine 5'-diphospho)-2-C-methyl-D-erythritol kinase [Paradonghicola geojensis]|nr:4-(cytidine 5'-diphospho)-2-C-methyl-D-erythritol kinase [Marivivens geojensis]